MKRFVPSVMAVIMVLSLGGVALEAEASPVATVRGDQMSPAENGTGSGGGGDETANSGPGTDGDAGSGDGSDSGAGVDAGTGGEPGGAGGAPPGVSEPRVMLTGFTSAPEEVMAGQDFTVSFTLLNTSPKKRVQNIKVSLSSGEGAAFLPANGSSSLYISGISSGDQSIQTMSFHSLASLEEKPYQMTLTVEYEDSDANAYQSQETVAVQVKQGVRADTSVPQVMPEMIQVGQDASVTFNIHNQGRTKLYNAKAVVKDGQPVTGEEMFIGTIEPGSSGAVDMLVRAEEESGDPLVIEVTYEDVDGKVTSLSKEVPLGVMPAETMEEFPEDDMLVDESVGLPLLPIMVGVLLLVLLVVILLVVRRSRRRSREQEDMESLSMMDDDPLVPADPPQA